MHRGAAARNTVQYIHHESICVCVRVCLHVRVCAVHGGSRGVSNETPFWIMSKRSDKQISQLF